MLPPSFTDREAGTGFAVAVDPMTGVPGHRVPLQVTPAQYAAMLRAEQEAAAAAELEETPA